LYKQTEAHLIYVRTIDKGAVNEHLKQYDTKTVDEKYYPLPNTDLIQLIFIGNFDIPFCTLRRYTEEKYRYYNESVGEEFNIVFPSDD